MMYDDFYGDINEFAGATEYVGSSAGDHIFVMLISVYMLIMGVALIFVIADYLLRGFGLYKIGKAEGRKNCWLAFVPFARTYFQGELCGPISLKQKTVKNPGIWLLIVPIVSGMVFAVGYFIFLMMTMIGAIAGSGSRSVESVATGMISNVIIFFIIVLIGATVYQAFIHVMYVLVNHQIYERYTTKNMAILHAVLGTLLPLYQSICMFIFGRRAEQSDQIDYEEPHPTQEEPIYREPETEQPENKNE